MQRSRAAAAALAFIVGFRLRAWSPWNEAPPERVRSPAPDKAVGLVLPVAAQQAWFLPLEERALEELLRERREAAVQGSA